MLALVIWIDFTVRIFVQMAIRMPSFLALEAPLSVEPIDCAAKLATDHTNFILFFDAFCPLVLRITGLNFCKLLACRIVFV